MWARLKATLKRSPGGFAYAKGRLGAVGFSESHAPALVLTHAAGFSKESWAPVLAWLEAQGDAIPSVDWFAVDLASHGESRARGLNEPEYRAILSVVEAEGLAQRTVLSAGHSLGGRVLATLELHQPNTFSHVLAIEPPLFTRLPLILCNILSWLGANPIARAARSR